MRIVFVEGDGVYLPSEKLMCELIWKYANEPSPVTLIKASGMTDAAFAREFGMSTATPAAWRAGHMPKRGYVDAMAFVVISEVMQTA